jgi:hypothetical protein
MENNKISKKYNRKENPINSMQNEKTIKEKVTENKTKKEKNKKAGQDSAKATQNVNSKLNQRVTEKESEITYWFYMSPNNINAKMIADLIEQRDLAEVELWEEMDILQIVLKDNKCIDFEPLNKPFKDETDTAFVKENKVVTIFAVTLEEGTF